MDRIDELRVFTTILEEGSLAAAARRLRRSPPAITRALASLEERAGTRLFQRTSRHLSPTPAAGRMAQRAQQLIGDYGQMLGTAESKADGPIRGLVRVTAPALFGRRHIVPLATRFIEQHPEARVDLVLTNYNLNLIEEGIDIALRIGPLNEQGLIARRVGKVHRVLCASPAYIARKARPRAPKDLARHDIVFVSNRPTSAEWRFRASGRANIVRLAPRLVVSDVDAAISAVKSGAGIARTLSYQVAEEFAAGTLLRLLREFELPAWPVHLVVPSARHLPAGVRAFLDLAAAGLARLPEIRR